MVPTSLQADGIAVPLTPDQDEVAKLLASCEARLLDSRRAIDETLELLRGITGLLSGGEAGGTTPPAIRAVLESHRDELVNLVVAALERSPRARDARSDFMNALVYRADEDSYRLGRRQLGLTESEKRVLDVLWQAMPGSASREDIRNALYPEGGKATAGAIDVFVSKLRQKLKLASGGQEFIDSVRGRGWSLKSELCRQRQRGEDGEAEGAKRA